MKSAYSDVIGDREIQGSAALLTESEILSAAIALLRRQLPPSWGLQSDAAAVTASGPVDAQIVLRAPDGGELLLLVEAKRVVASRDVASVLRQLRWAAREWTPRPVLPVIVARYLAEASRTAIIEAGAGYIDLTGNISLASDRPAMIVRGRGEDRDPWRGPGRPRSTLTGPPAARVVRALLDFAPPYSVPELAARSRASTGATYRVVEFLEEERLLDRGTRGPITAVRWRALLERWSRDYGFSRSNNVATFLEPRGLSALTARLRDLQDLPYAITGSLAAQRVAAYAPARLAMLYVTDIERAIATLGLRPTTTGANVALAIGAYDVTLERTRLEDGLTYAAFSQVAVDLLSGPGRNPSEAVALMEWMEANERAWRI